MGLDRQSFVLPALALLAVAAAWMTIAGFRAPVGEISEESAERPRYHIEGARWLRHDAQGLPLFELTARDVDYFDGASMEMTGIEMFTEGRDGEWTLTATRGNQIKAADLLGLNRNTLRKKIRELGVSVYRSSRSA